MKIERTDEFFSVLESLLPKEGSSAPVNRRKSSPNFSNIKEFHVQGKQILKITQEMNRLVQENFGAYIAMAQPSVLSSSNNPTLSQDSREELDRAIEQYCLTSNAQLKEVTRLAKECTSSKSQIKHAKQVVSLLTRRYKEVVSRIHNMKKLYSLEVSKNGEQLRLNIQNSSNDTTWSIQQKTGTFPINLENESIEGDERAVLEAENRMMFAELENVSDEAMKMETKMEDITSMAKLFGNQIFEQHEMIERIGDNVDTSHRNIISGNKQLIRAEENTGKGSRFLVYVLLILSFTLLFLDFYYN